MDISIFKRKKIVQTFPQPRTIDVNKLASSIEKAKKTLEVAKKYGNADAIQTWEIILYKLQINWKDAMVEMASNSRHYQFL